MWEKIDCKLIEEVGESRVTSSLGCSKQSSKGDSSGIKLLAG